MGLNIRDLENVSMANHEKDLRYYVFDFEKSELALHNFLVHDRTVGRSITYNETTKTTSTNYAISFSYNISK